MHYDFRQTITDAINKVFFILRKENDHECVSHREFYIFIVYRVEPVSPKEKRPKMIK